MWVRRAVCSVLSLYVHMSSRTFSANLSPAILQNTGICQSTACGFLYNMKASSWDKYWFCKIMPLALAGFPALTNIHGTYSPAASRMIHNCHNFCTTLLDLFFYMKVLVFAYLVGLMVHSRWRPPLLPQARRHSKYNDKGRMKSRKKARTRPDMQKPTTHKRDEVWHYIYPPLNNQNTPKFSHNNAENTMLIRPSSQYTIIQRDTKAMTCHRQCRVLCQNIQKYRSKEHISSTYTTSHAGSAAEALLRSCHECQQRNKVVQRESKTKI